MTKYFYKGYTIKNCGYHQPDHCVWWEAVDKNGYACFHGHTLREVEMLINDSEWENKIKAKDEEITRLKRENFDLNGCLLAEQELAEKRNALIKELAEDLSGYLCESECNVACSSFGHCCSQTSHQIIAKAREVTFEGRV